MKEEEVYVFVVNKAIDEVANPSSADEWATSSGDKAKGSYAYFKITERSDSNRTLPPFIGPPVITNMVLGKKSGPNDESSNKIIRTSSAPVSNVLRGMLTDYGFDDAATGQGLLNFFFRALNSGAIDPEDVENAGVNVKEVEAGSFRQIVEARRK